VAALLDALRLGPLELDLGRGVLEELALSLDLVGSLNEAEERVLLLEVDNEHGAACLEVVLELLIQVEGRLDLGEGAELGVVVFDEDLALLVLVDDGVQSADRDVVDAHVGVVAAAEADGVRVAETDHVEVLLLGVGTLGGVDLAGLDDDEVALGLLDLEDQVLALLMRVVVLELLLAQLAVEGLPGVSRYVLRHPLVLVAPQPLAQALKVHELHRARALAGRYQGARLFILLLTEANSAHRVIVSAVGGSILLSETQLARLDVVGVDQVLLLPGHARACMALALLL